MWSSSSSTIYIYVPSLINEATATCLAASQHRHTWSSLPLYPQFTVASGYILDYIVVCITYAWSSMGWSCSLPSYWRTTASGSCITPCAKYLDHLLVSSGSTSWPASLRCPFFRLLHLFRQPRAASAPSIPAGPILYSKIIIIIIYIDDGNEEASSLNAERDGFN